MVRRIDRCIRWPANSAPCSPPPISRQGGADVAIQSVLGHMLVKGMLVYSGGGAWGLPYIHLGAVALKENFEASKPMFRTFGERVAQKAKELFEPGK